MRKKILIYSLLPGLVIVGVLGVAAVSAHGWGLVGGNSNLSPEQFANAQQIRFQTMAELLGISLDEVKNAWAKGESLRQLAQDHGITADELTQKMHDARLQQLKSQLQILVNQHIITQAQADQRLQFIKNNQGQGLGGMRGFGHGMMRGW